MIPEHKYIVAHGIKMVTIELVENYHGSEAVIAFYEAMVGKTCISLNSDSNIMHHPVGFYVYDYKEWLHGFVAPKPYQSTFPPDACAHKSDNPTNPEEIPDPTCVIVVDSILINIFFL